MSNRVVNKPGALKLELFGDGNSVVFGENTQGFRGQMYIGTPDCPAYGCFVSVGPGSTSNGVFIRVLDDNSRVEIGKDCMFSDEINIWASDTHTILDEAGHVTNMGRFISIDDHVWVGKRATILKNTYIAPNSVIGWGAVVSGTFDKAGSVVAGNPATVVKTITDWSRMRPCQYIRKTGKPM